MQAEKAVLGTMLKEPHLINETNLQVDQFESVYHRELFKAMKELDAKGKAVDVVTLITYVNPQLFGGANYLTELQNLANEKRFEDHAKAVQDAYREKEKRNIISTAQLENWDIDSIMSELNKIQDDDVSDHSDITGLTIDVYEAPYHKVEMKKGANTGLTRLNLMTNGLQDAELTILAARPSMGKSDVMLHLAKQAGWTGYLPIIFSLEMSRVSLRDRLIASTGSFNRGKMRDPHSMLSDGQKEKWMPAINRLSETKIQIFDKSGQTLPEIRMKVRKMASQHKDRKPIIFIDYLTLIKPVENTNNMHLQIGTITKGLKAIAKEFNCPVVVLAQLSRGVEQRQDKRPMLSDLRESGSIEEDADVAMFLYRDAYYSKDDNDSSLEIIVAKNRNGAVGTVFATYNKFTGEITENDGQ
ncbi:replicative DNA helicase [Planococcus chinensis]|uniref:replicative DNA helicase n=1 Tax=Planococcus chinensis TaxID=272917 RepID=UPI0021E17E84|nr:DnaB-like helicase C-terminal domain-containing protein [Planococcus chinensis]